MLVRFLATVAALLLVSVQAGSHVSAERIVNLRAGLSVETIFNASDGAGGPLAGNPTVPGSGTKYESATDVRGGGPMPLNFGRVYWSGAPRTGSLVGSKWTAHYFQRAQLPRTNAGEPWPANSAPPAVLVMRPDGGWYQFDLRNGVYVPEANIPVQLERRTTGGQTTFVFRSLNDVSEVFDATGTLLYLEHRSGQRHTLTHDALGRPSTVTDDYGRVLRFEYSETEGYLSAVIDPTGRRTGYRHDEDGNLIGVDYADGTSLTYHYESLTYRYALTGITDERGIRLSTYTYDHRGRVLESVQAEGALRHQFRYGADELGNTETTIIDPYGTTRVYRYRQIFDRPYLTETTQPCSSCGSSQVAQRTYDAAGYVLTETDFRGHVRRMVRNSRGLVERLVEAEGTPEQRITTTEWHPVFYLAVRVTEPTAVGPRVIELAYDARGNLERRSVTVNGETRSWAFTYDAKGLVLTADGPRTDVNDRETMVYDARGNLATRTDALGHVTSYPQYDADSLLRRMVDANGQITTYAYDDRRRLIEANVGGEITTYGYDAASNLQTLRLPDQSELSYTYDDAQRLIEVEDNLGHRIEYTLNAAGDRVAEQTFNRDGDLVETMAREFDPLGRLQSLIGAEDQRSRYEYDGNHNETAMTDPNGHRTDYAYDALDRLIQTTDPNTPVRGQIRFAYDPQDNLTEVIDPRNLTTRYTYSGFDELTRLTSPDTGITDYQYDPAGNLTRRTDARGVTANYQYDAANRVTQIAYPAHQGEPAETLQFEYDDTTANNAGKGRLTRITDGSGHTRFQYDRFSRVIEKAQQVGASPARSLKTEYNAQGQVQQHTLPSGAEIRYSYRADGRAGNPRGTATRLRAAGQGWPDWTAEQGQRSRVLSIRVNGVEVVREIDYHAFG